MHLYFYRFVLIVSILLLLPLCVVNVCAEERPSAQEEKRSYVVRPETYDQVLDLLFPRDVLEGALGYAFVLRYEPPFEAESQMTILSEGEHIKVVEYTSLDGNIYEKLNTIFGRTHREDVAEMAKQVRVQKRVVNILPAEITRLRESFYDCTCQAASYERKQISKNMREVTVIDDGTQYRLWYRGAGMGESHYNFIGSNVDVSPPPPDEHPLIDWMRQARRAIKKSPTAHNSVP